MQSFMYCYHWSIELAGKLVYIYCRYKESIVVKDLMEFFKSNSASVNAPWLDEYGRPHFPELVVDPQASAGNFSDVLIGH